MKSLEKYVVKLIFEFFSKTKENDRDLYKSLLTYILENSNIHFEGLTVMCKEEKSGFYVSVTCKCLSIKMNYERVVNI